MFPIKSFGEYLAKTLFTAPVIGAAILDALLLVANAFGVKLNFPDWIYSAVLILGILIANFQLFRSQSHDIEVKLKPNEVSISKPLQHNPSLNTINIHPEIALVSTASLDIYNHSSTPTDLNFIVVAVNSNIALASTELSNSKVTVNLPKSQERNDNPIHIQGNRIIHKCKFRAELPIKIPIESPFAYLGALRTLEIVIGVEHAGKEMQTLDPISMDVDQFQRSIEHQLLQFTKEQVTVNPDRNPSALFALKEYWISRDPVEQKSE